MGNTTLKLDNRLGTLASLVREGCLLIDVGTDHAKLPAYLLLEGRVRRAIGTDVREGPLNKGRATLERYGLSGQVDLIHTDGLCGICADGECDIVIAGMGGELIARILFDAPQVRCGSVRLLLQPMSGQRELRQYLTKNGFRLERELLAWEDDRIYNLLVAVFTGKPEPLAERDEFFGKLEKNDPLLHRYLQKMGVYVEKMRTGLAASASPSEKAVEEARILTEALDYWKGELA